MKEISVNEYVRTKEGNIYKFTDEIKNDIQLQDFILCNKGKVIKHSNYIIDLIECGDYVNENKITYIDKDKFIKGQINLWTDVELRGVYGDYERLKYTNKDIKSIVTHEQFEQMKYIVGDE